MRNQAHDQGYTIGRSWESDKEVYAIHGNNGCEMWFKRFEEISKTGKIRGLNTPGKYLKITRSEEEYHQLSRRFGRYKRLRTDTLTKMRDGQRERESAQQGKFIEWREVHAKIQQWKGGTGYTSEEEGRKYRERKGDAADRKGRQKANGKGKSSKKGKGKNNAGTETPETRRSY